MSIKVTPPLNLSYFEGMYLLIYIVLLFLPWLVPNKFYRMLASVHKKKAIRRELLQAVTNCYLSAKLGQMAPVKRLPDYKVFQAFDRQLICHRETIWALPGPGAGPGKKGLGKGYGL